MCCRRFCFAFVLRCFFSPCFQCLGFSFENEKAIVFKHSILPQSTSYVLELLKVLIEICLLPAAEIAQLGER